MNTVFDKFFEDLEDPRQDWKVDYSLRDIVVMAILSVIGGCQGWEEIELWCKHRRSLFLELLGSSNIPSHDTFNRVFTLISVNNFEHCFSKMISYVTSQKEEIIRDIISIDGKSLRASKNNAVNKTALHVVNAWSVKHGMVLGQKKTEKKSNEIKAIPELLEILNIKNNVITIDAAGTQKNIASKIISHHGDYVLALKRNHPKAYTEVADYFSEKISLQKLKPSYDKFDGEKHGRTERRRYYIAPAKMFKELASWEGIKHVVALESIRSEKGKGKVSTEIRYYISSCNDSHEFIFSCIRNHWHVENKLHWSLDVNFREDQNKSKNENAAINLSILRKIAINALRNEKSYKKSVPLKRRKAGINNEYLKKVIQFE